jgi:hypothetical protein
MPVRTPDKAIAAMPEVFAELPPACRRQLVTRLHQHGVGRSSWRQLFRLPDREAVALIEEYGLPRRPRHGGGAA